MMTFAANFVSQKDIKQRSEPPACKMKLLTSLQWQSDLLEVPVYQGLPTFL